MYLRICVSASMSVPVPVFVSTSVSVSASVSMFASVSTSVSMSGCVFVRDVMCLVRMRVCAHTQTPTNGQSRPGDGVILEGSGHEGGLRISAQQHGSSAHSSRGF